MTVRRQFMNNSRTLQRWAHVHVQVHHDYLAYLNVVIASIYWI
jgi:hypothetical protein